MAAREPAPTWLPKTADPLDAKRKGSPPPTRWHAVTRLLPARRIVPLWGVCMGGVSMRFTSWLATIVVVIVAALAGQMVFAQGYGGGGGGYDRPGGSGTIDALRTARKHATNAVRSESVRDSLWHLGHLVSCLEL